MESWVVVCYLIVVLSYDMSMRYTCDWKVLCAMDKLYMICDPYESRCDVSMSYVCDRKVLCAMRSIS